MVKEESSVENVQIFGKFCGHFGFIILLETLCDEPYEIKLDKYWSSTCLPVYSITGSTGATDGNWASGGGKKKFRIDFLH